MLSGHNDTPSPPSNYGPFASSLRPVVYKVPSPALFESASSTASEVDDDALSQQEHEVEQEQAEPSHQALPPPPEQADTPSARSITDEDLFGALAAADEQEEQPAARPTAASANEVDLDQQAAGPIATTNVADLDQDAGPSLISEATDAIRLLQDASERENVLLAFRKAAAEAQSRAKTLEDEAREATKRASEAKSALSHLLSIIQQIEKGPGEPSSSTSTQTTQAAPVETYRAPLSLAGGENAALFPPPDLGLGDASEAGLTDSYLNLSQAGPSTFAGTSSNKAAAPGAELVDHAVTEANARRSSESASIPAPSVGVVSSFTPVVRSHAGSSVAAAAALAAVTAAAGPSTSTPATTGSSSSTTSDGRKRPRTHTAASLESRRCDDCGTSDTVLWRHIEDEVFCNACALRRRRAAKRAHLEAKKVAGAVSASASAAGAGFDQA